MRKLVYKRAKWQHTCLKPIWWNEKQDIQITSYQYDYLCFGEAGVEHLSNGKNSSCYLLCSVFVIVGSYPQHHHLEKTTDTLFTEHTLNSTAAIKAWYRLSNILLNNICWISCRIPTHFPFHYSKPFQAHLVQIYFPPISFSLLEIRTENLLKRE